MPTILPSLISYDEWMTQTAAGFFNSRSTGLEALDTALREYNANKTQRTFEDLQVKFQLWAFSKDDFKTSIRNITSGAPVKLHYELFSATHTSAETTKELKLMRDGQKDMCYQMFRGSEMRLRLTPPIALSAASTVYTTASDAEKLLKSQGISDFNISEIVQRIISKIRSASTTSSSSTKSVGFISDIINRVASFIIEIVKSAGVSIAQFVRMAISQIMDLVKELLLSLIPFATTIKFAAEFAPQVYNLVKKQFTINSSERSRTFLASGSPKAAIDSLCTSLRRERNDMALDLMTGTITAVVDVFAPAGTAALKFADSFRKALTKFVRTLDAIKQMGAANTIFGSNNIARFDLSIFEVSPLVACYIIAYSTQSTLVAMLSNDVCSFRVWIKYTSRVIETHIRPIQEEARRMISEHICEIAGIGNAARYEVAIKEKSKLFLGDIHRAAHLSEIRRFDHGRLNHITPPERTISQHDALSVSITQFNHLRLKPTETQRVDPVKQMRDYELSLSRINNEILGRSLINKASFQQETLSTQIITREEWRTMTWVTFGRRHEFTQSIDNALIDYQAVCNRHMRMHAGIRPVVKKEQLNDCLNDIEARINHLTQKIAVPLHHWLNPMNAVHQASSRLPAMTRLKVLVDTEVSRLSHLNSEYAARKRDATLLFDKKEKSVA